VHETFHESGQGLQVERRGFYRARRAECRRIMAKGGATRVITPARAAHRPGRARAGGPGRGRTR
jgi:hypothetical protein